jgi:hypothetical protein
MLRMTRRLRRRHQRKEHPGLAIAVLGGLACGLMLVRAPAVLYAPRGFTAAREPANKPSSEPVSERPIAQLERDAGSRAYANSFLAANGMRVVLTAKAVEPMELLPDLPRERLDRFAEHDREAR